MRLLRSLLLCTLLAPAFAACERKPSAEEIQAAVKAEEAQRPPPASPTPKPGDWMYNRKTKLDEKPRR